MDNNRHNERELLHNAGEDRAWPCYAGTTVVGRTGKEKRETKINVRKIAVVRERNAAFPFKYCN